MLTDKRVLLVEAEFLLALDMQRVLEAAQAASIVCTRSLAEAAALAPRFSEWQLAIVAMHSDSPAAIALVRELLQAGLAVVAISANTAGKQTLPGFQSVPLLGKPFADADLLTACAVALTLSEGPHPMTAG